MALNRHIREYEERFSTDMSVSIICFLSSKKLTLRSFQQRKRRGMPFCSVPEGDIGNRCVGNPAILHNQYIIFLSTQGKKLVQHATVCTFQFVCDVITRYQFQARNLPYRIWNIYNLLYVLSILLPGSVSRSCQGSGFRISSKESAGQLPHTPFSGVFIRAL